MVWVMISAALVFLMVPALSLIYSGMGNRTFALTLFRLPLITCAFVGLQVCFLVRRTAGKYTCSLLKVGAMGLWTRIHGIDSSVVGW